MKKMLLKIGFIALCVGVIVFLLLPFLETTSPSFSSLKTSQAQLVSDNPLTAIAKRLSALFGRKERARQNLASQKESTAAPAAELYASATNTPDFSSESPYKIHQIDATNLSSTVAVPAQQVRDYEDASFQVDNGEWVLVRQTAPQSSAPGMHEINVHDNPYDRYVRQERARHFTPRTSQPEIPASKWARFTRPIKAFFGLDDPQPVAESSVQVHRTDEKLASLGSAQDKLTATGGNKNSPYPYMRLPIPDITPQQWAKLSLPQRERLQERQAARDFAELLSGERIAEQAAKFLANSLYPNPQNEKEKQQKETLIERLTAQNKQYIRETILAKIQENAADKEPVDELAYMTGCQNTSLPAGKLCEDPDQPTPLPQHEPADVLKQAQERNAESFFKDTKFILPQGLPFTPIVGPTDPKNFKYMADAKTGEVYNFLYKQQKCDTRTCYWVPNSNPSDFKLTDTFTTIGAGKLTADPYNTYDTFWEEFKQAKLEALGPDTTPEDKKRAEKEAREQWEKHRPNWVPWGEDLVVQLNEDNKEALSAPLDQPSDKNPSFIVVTDPAIAPDVAALVGPTSFVYNQTSLVNSKNPVEAGAQLTDSFAVGVNNTKEAVQKVTTESTQQSVAPVLNRIFTEGNKNGGGLQGHLDAFKKWSQMQKGTPAK